MVPFLAPSPGGEMMITVAVTNQKGGVGKSGVTVCLAGVLVDHGYKVLVIDLEPQATATEWLGARPTGDVQSLPEDLYGPALMEALLHGKALPVYHTTSGIDLAPSGNALSGFDIAVASSKPAGERELLLRASLEQLQPLWDVVLIDCPPSLSLLTVNALAAADSSLMPVKLEAASRTPLVRLFLATREVQQQFNEKLELMGVLGTFHITSTNHQAAMFDWLKGQFGEDGPDAEPHPIVFQTPIRQNVHISESFGHQKTVTHYARDEKIRQCNGVIDFEAFAQEFIERAELAPPATQKAANE